MISSYIYIYIIFRERETERELRPLFKCNVYLVENKELICMCVCVIDCCVCVVFFTGHGLPREKEEILNILYAKFG